MDPSLNSVVIVEVKRYFTLVKVSHPYLVLDLRKLTEKRKELIRTRCIGQHFVSSKFWLVRRRDRPILIWDVIRHGDMSKFDLTHSISLHPCFERPSF